MQKLKKYKLNICNLQKHKTLYNRGMRPYVFSYKKYEKNKKGWEQGGDSLKYEQRFSKSMKILNLEYLLGYLDIVISANFPLKSTLRWKTIPCK